MLNRRQLEDNFRKIQVVRAPKRRLATFGTSRIDYQVVTDVPGFPDRSRLRTGLVIAEKPQIITPHASREQFAGFGPDSGRFADALVGHYGEALRGLEYNFRNEPSSTRVELKSPDVFLRDLAERHDGDGGFHTAVIRGTDKFWELALMKFIVEETLASFSSNVRELQEHGFFDTEEDRVRRQHDDIRAWFERARVSRSAIPVLAGKLKEYGLFETYQDQFFRLVNS
jgi:hypothetical protein